MNAELRFLDGKTESLANVGSIDIRDGAVIARRWFRVIAIAPTGVLRCVKLVRGKKVTQHDFGRAAL